MSSELAKSICESREVRITTYGLDGVPGTVPVWFDFHGGKFYISTYPDSHKIRKIEGNPEVRLTFGGPNGPSLTGLANIVFHDDLLRQIAPVHNARYPDGPWDSVDHLVQMWSERVERCLLEIVPS